MRGIPKHLNTREDYEYLCTHFEEDVWKPALQLLLDERKAWFNTGLLATEEEGIEDATHKIVSSKDNDDIEIFSQFELQENPHSKLLTLGYSAEEVEDLLSA